VVKAVGLSFFLTFIPFFDIPVFWPILVIYFFALCFMTMRRQIAHMWKHKYIPFDIGKKTYKVRATPTAAILRAARLLAARSVVEWEPDVRLARSLCSALLCSCCRIRARGMRPFQARRPWKTRRRLYRHLSRSHLRPGSLRRPVIKPVQQRTRGRQWTQLQGRVVCAWSEQSEGRTRADILRRACGCRCCCVGCLVWEMHRIRGIHGGTLQHHIRSPQPAVPSVQ
jgi:hypothetical protein